MTSRPIIAAVLLTLSSLSTLAAIPGIPQDGVVTIEQIDTAIATIEIRDDLGAQAKSQVLEQLRDARAEVQNRRASETAAARFASAIDDLPQETQRLLEALNEETLPPPTMESLGVGDDTPLDDLEQRLSREAAGLASSSLRLAQLEADIVSISNRPQDARNRTAELRILISGLESNLAAEPPSADPELLNDARRLATRMRLAARRAELDELDKELASQNHRLDHLRAQRDIATRDRTVQQRRVNLLTTIVNESRRSSAEQSLAAAAAVEQRFADAHPAVRGLAQGNAELTRELPAIAQGIETTTASLTTAEDAARRIEANLARSRQRLEIAGVSQAIGRLLGEELRALPGVSQYRAQLLARRETLSAIGLAQVRIEEERLALTSIGELVDETMLAVEADTTDDDELTLTRRQVRELLLSRRELLNEVSASYARYLSVLGDLDVSQRRVLDAAEEYRNFLNRHLAWIPSSPPVGSQTIGKTGEALAWFSSPTNWHELASVPLRTFQNRPVMTVAAILLIVFLFFARRPLARRNNSLNGRVGPLSTDSIGLTVQSLLIAALRMLPIPLALWFVGVALVYFSDQTVFSQSVSAGLLAVAPFLYNTLLFHELCAKDGVAQIHFGWTPENLHTLRRQFKLLIALGTPLAILAVTFYRSPITAYQESIARIAFVALLVVFAMVLHPIEHPRRGVVADFYRREPTSWLSRLRWVWYTLAVGGPLGLAALTLNGYMYTAAVLTADLVDTFWLVIAIVVINLVVMRWLALTKRRISWHAELRQRETQGAEVGDPEGRNLASFDDGQAALVTSQPLDIEAVDQQMRRLLEAFLIVVGVVGLWLIWSGTLPALNVLDEISLWSTTSTIGGNEIVDTVDLADIALALVILAATVIGSRNLPGLTEIAVLQHLKLQPGSRYTINTLLRYIVITIGVVAVLNIIGLPWSRVQWLVAALSVGLGFGLQEIVANFVSGLIILFERPVRVGDTVTVGSLTGTVSRVRIRATTITDWDRREIVVPNKAFITEQVVNWTLSDPITRIIIELGIAYGSDVKLAHRVIEETLKANPLVLDEPESRAYFVGFGDSSLNFKLYMYSRNLSDRFPIIHSVHNDIYAALREHGIQIPFPQRDLHIRSTVENFGRSN